MVERWQVMHRARGRAPLASCAQRPSQCGVWLPAVKSLVQPVEPVRACIAALGRLSREHPGETEASRAAQ